MSTPAGGRPEIRASDAEREDIARTLQAAAGDGRLTLDEVDHRLSQLYEARFRSELAVLVEDLPTPADPDQPTIPVPFEPSVGRRIHPALAVHAVVVMVFGVLLIGRWLASDAVFFWPAFPMFWLGIGLVVHARIRSGFGRGGRSAPWRARTT